MMYIRSCLSSMLKIETSVVGRSSSQDECWIIWGLRDLNLCKAVLTSFAGLLGQENKKQFAPAHEEKSI